MDNIAYALDIGLDDIPLDQPVNCNPPNVLCSCGGATQTLASAGSTAYAETPPTIKVILVTAWSIYCPACALGNIGDRHD